MASTIPIKDKVDFLELIIIPFASRKSWRIVARVSTSLGPRSGEVFMPWKSLVLMVEIKALLNPFATRRKSRGERGHPCLRALPEEKKGEAALLIRTAKVTKEIQAIIHLMKGTSNPRCVSSSVIKD